MSLLNQTKKSKLVGTKLPKLSIQQQIDNSEVIQRMNRKITFTKNQRHLGQTITYNEALNNNTISKQTYDSNNLRKKDGSNRLGTTFINKQPGSKPKFKCVPELILFEHFEPHHTYESEVKLVNHSQHIQRVKITPFNRKQFNIFSVQYPRQDTGEIAPGMAVTITIRFRPLSLADIEDDLLVIFNGGSITVPIDARRERPMIEWPSQIDCGHCWVGNSMEKTVKIVNHGGQADYRIVGVGDEGNDGNINDDKNSSYQTITFGCFKVTPSTLRFNSQFLESQLNIKFIPDSKGTFEQKIVFKTNQGKQQQIRINLRGGAYTAQLVLEQINGEKIKQQSLLIPQSNLYLNGTEIGQESKGTIKIRNLAVVDVDYFWHIVYPGDQNDSRKDVMNINSSEPMLSISNPKGKLTATSSFQFDLAFHPTSRTPQNIKAELYLVNVPKESLLSQNVVKRINGQDAIQCLIVNIKTRPKESTTQVYPLHRQIVEPVYKNVPVLESFKIANNSSSSRSYKITLIKVSEYCRVLLRSQSQGSLEPKQEKAVKFSYEITQLSKQQQKGYFLIEFDNSPSKIFSVGGFVQYPRINYSDTEIFYGICRTYTKSKKYLTLKNTQTNALEFRVNNPIRFYQLDFYDFYEFQDEQSSLYKKKRLTLRNKVTSEQLLNDKIYTIQPQSDFIVQFEYSTNQPCVVNEWIDIQVVDGRRNRIPVLLETQEISLQMSRNDINLRQIYKGNLYNSNKFLNKELSIENTGNIEATFQFTQPNQENCIIKVQPMRFTVPPRQKKRIDLLIEPIKTGDFETDIEWKYFDDFKVNPESYPQLAQTQEFDRQQGKNRIVQTRKLPIKALIKGVEIKYYIKDQSRVKRVRQKAEESAVSVKLSTMSFKSSNKTSLHDQEKLVYPFLQELNFYNCEINQVRQMEIIIQNDSGLTAQYKIFAQNFHTLEKPQSSRKSNRGLVGQQEQAFSSQMGKTFLQSRVLDKSQKVHLSNNKGMSIMCEPCQGFLHKKQTQKVVITMFNDTSGRFKDSLIIDIKDHEQKKFPMDIHIKGTPVLLSRNQLGINFNEQIPLMNIGSTLVNNGRIKKSIKVVNKGPKPVNMNWKIYKYNQPSSDKDLFKLQFLDASPGSSDLVDIKWSAIEPSIDFQSPFSIQPKQKILKGREEFSFALYVDEAKEVKTFQGLMICQPELRDAERAPIKMENLAVIVSGQSVEPFLKIDAKHSNHVNKLELFSTQHVLKQTNSNNNMRKLKLKNQHKANLQFELDIQSKNPQFSSFRIVSISTNSPVNPFDGNKTFVKHKKYVLAFESFIEIVVELTANKKDQKEWPLQPKTRKDGNVVIKYSNGRQQRVQLVGWLYRPWVQLQMPNHGLYSVQNFTIQFGVVHIKNSKKMSVYLVNPSKSDGKFTITYLKYQQSKQINFQKALWTQQDYEDMGITDQKDCFFLSQDEGTVLNRSIPIHYIPGTLALPSNQDEHTVTHKPVRIDFLFKPQKNVLYKSKFRIAIQDGLFYDIVVRGQGSLDEEVEVK